MSRVARAKVAGGLLGVECKRALRLAPGGRLVAALGGDVGKLAERRREIGVDRERPREAFHRFGLGPQSLQRIAALKPGGRMAGLGRDDPVEDGQCLVEPMLLAKHGADRSKHHDVARCQLQRLPQQAMGGRIVLRLLAAPGSEIEHHRIGLARRERDFGHRRGPRDVALREGLLDPRAPHGIERSGRLCFFVAIRHNRTDTCILRGGMS